MKEKMNKLSAETEEILIKCDDNKNCYKAGFTKKPL